MSRLSEFELIETLFAPLATAPGAFGLRDDAAIIPPRAGCDLVVTADTIVEGIDFLAADPPDSIAKKALRVNLSDLAAKGAEPFGYVLNLSLPHDFSQARIEQFARGLRDDQERYGIGLLGGDTGTISGPWSIAVTAFGHVPAGEIVRRAGAGKGDLVFVSGTIGDSAGGLALLKGGASDMKAEFENFLIDRYRLPDPPVRFAQRLRKLANAAVDISDGLMADLGHVAKASAVHIAVEASRIPFSPALKSLWGEGPDAIVRAATAGDDYQIAFTAPSGNEAAILKAARDNDVVVTAVGRVEAGDGVSLLDDNGREIPVPRPGYRHF
jgi:thiamine-monophosphate kinase